MKAKTKARKKVYVVFSYGPSLDPGGAVKVFAKKKDAESYCKKQNDKNKPEFDDYGHCGGVFHDYYMMEVE